MRDRTRNTATTTDKTISNNLDVSNDQDKSGANDTIELVRTPPPQSWRSLQTVPEGPSSTKIIFLETASESSPRHSRTEAENWESTGQERVTFDSDQPADPLLLLEHCYCYYCYVSERYVHTYSLTLSCQSGTSPLTGWTA